MDPNDTQSRTLKLIVRTTSRQVEYMYSCEPDMTQLLREGGTDLLTSAGSSNGESTPTGRLLHVLCCVTLSILYCCDQGRRIK